MVVVYCLFVMSKSRIIVVEDEEDIQEILEYTLTREGFEVSCASDGASGLKHIRRELPDLVLLDLMLPDVDGLEICRQLKADPETRGISVIMVTAKGEESEIVLGLGLGADDYIPKPFSTRELVARTRSVLRRAGQSRSEEDVVKVVVHGSLRIDPRSYKVHVGGEELDFTVTEFKILHLLASNPGRIFSRSQILSESRGALAAAYDRSVDAHVRTIRKKLDSQRDLIETVRAIGYRFAEAL
ncbi:MAG: two-component system alkaline phosphatase synthesis response regulator PhoP [Planctomycetota bacterium]|jgi:two-component system alkaline phosphatase synthesis response regulator PhoP